MALSTAQRFQAVRIPTVDGVIDSIDAYAFLGILQVETSAPVLSTALKYQILRLPIVDGTVDEKDAYALFQTPESGGLGNVTDVFSLNWNIDPTWTDSQPEITRDGALSFTLGDFIGLFVAGGSGLEFLGGTIPISTSLTDIGFRGTRLEGSLELSALMGAQITRYTSINQATLNVTLNTSGHMEVAAKLNGGQERFAKVRGVTGKKALL